MRLCVFLQLLHNLGYFCNLVESQSAISVVLLHSVTLKEQWFYSYERAI